jgi:hypothetical protein
MNKKTQAGLEYMLIMTILILFTSIINILFINQGIFSQHISQTANYLSECNDLNNLISKIIVEKDLKANIFLDYDYILNSTARLLILNSSTQPYFCGLISNKIINENESNEFFLLAGEYELSYFLTGSNKGVMFNPVTYIEIILIKIYNTFVNNTTVNVNESVCFNTTVTQGTYNVSKVWIELSVPKSTLIECWASGGSCDSSCQYNDLGTTNYYLDPGCSDDCSISGSFYVPTGSCDVDGSGNCYKVSAPVNYYTSCTQGTACNSSCSGTPTNCIICPNCTFCGCNETGIAGTQQVWNEDFTTNTDWATWAAIGSGIDYINDAVNCIDDDNDDCLHVDDVVVGDLYLYKQSSEDLSACSDDSAWFYIANVVESGNIDADDCVYVAFSDDGGSTWGTDNLIFCNDNPALTYNYTLPNSYLTNDFRVRVRVQNFQSNNEELWLDGFQVSCYKDTTACSGTPTNCSTYTNSSACGTCGCNWREFAWDWTLEASTPGYSSYSTCTWKIENIYSSEIINLTLSDTGSTCSGTINDTIYGLDYQIINEGNYTLITGYANDTTGYEVNENVNINITGVII